MLNAEYDTLKSRRRHKQVRKMDSFPLRHVSRVRAGKHTTTARFMAKQKPSFGVKA